MKLFWTTEKRRIKDLLPADYNPRQMTEAQAKELRKSLQKFGLVEIPAIDEDGTILAGHMRVATMIDLGMGEETIDVRVPNRKLTDEEAMEYNLRSNKNTGEWDLAKLFAMPDGLLEEVGFSNKEIQKLVDGNTTVEEDDYDTDKGLELPVRVARGEIWQLGSHRLMCGDSTSKEDVERLMDGKKADMAFTDPPYNTGMGEKNRDSTWLNHMFEDSYTDEEWDNFMASFVATLARSLKNDSVAYVCLDWRRNYELIPHIKEHFHLSNTIVWDKVVHGLGSDYKYTYELINVCKKGKPMMDTHQGDQAEYSDVWHIQRKVGKDEDHATKKPIELITRPIKHASPLGGIVLDIFLGSGSTIIACEQTGRVCYGMEIDPKYCTVILDRWEKLTGKKAVCVSSS